MKDLTPKGLKCGIAACPGIFQDEKTGKLYIRGAKIDAEKSGLPVGENEAVVEVPKELFQNLK